MDNMEMTHWENFNFNFWEALKILRCGWAVARLHWNWPGQFLRLQTPDENSKMTLPYIYISTVAWDLVPWTASQTDLLADDWYIKVI